MNDAYERRALQLHLGSILQTLSRILESERSGETIGGLIRNQPFLADVPLLEHALGHLTVHDFAAAALHAFCLWPQQLLDDPLDRIALALSVRDHLFPSNPGGWTAYAATLRPQVPWFGERLPPMRVSRQGPARRIDGTSGDTGRTTKV